MQLTAATLLLDPVSSGPERTVSHTPSQRPSDPVPSASEVLGPGRGKHIKLSPLSRVGYAPGPLSILPCPVYPFSACHTGQKTSESSVLLPAAQDAPHMSVPLINSSDGVVHLFLFWLAQEILHNIKLPCTPLSKQLVLLLFLLKPNLSK